MGNNTQHMYCNAKFIVYVEIFKRPSVLNCSEETVQRAFSNCTPLMPGWCTNLLLSSCFGTVEKKLSNFYQTLSVCRGGGCHLDKNMPMQVLACRNSSTTGSLDCDAFWLSLPCFFSKMFGVAQSEEASIISRW